MSHVVFAVPFLLDASLRFARAAAAVDGVRLGVVSQEPLQRLPDDLRAGLGGFARVHDALDPAQLADGVREIARGWGGRVDRLIGILEPLQVPLAQARERLGIPGLDAETARNFRDKARMKDVLAAHGLPCARHLLCTSLDDALGFAERTGFPVVVKPPAGAGAKQTFRTDSAEQLRSCLRSMPPSAAAPVLLEEFLAGREFSFDSVSVGGRHVFGSVNEYLPTPLEVVETPWIQWAVLLPARIDGPEFAPIREAAPRALDALGLRTGMSHLEWFRRDDGSIAISEVGARPPGAQFVSLLSWAHDLDFYRAWVRLEAFGTFEPPERRWAVGAAFLRGQGRGRVVAVHGIEQAQREVGELVVEAKLPQPGQSPSGTYEGDGYVILRHADTEVVREALQKLVSSMRVELG